MILSKIVALITMVVVFAMMSGGFSGPLILFPIYHHVNGSLNIQRHLSKQTVTAVVSLHVNLPNKFPETNC